MYYWVQFKFLESIFVLPPWSSIMNRINLEIYGIQYGDRSVCFRDLANTVYSDYFSINTDGSKSDTGVGAAVLFSDINFTLSWRLHSDHSVVSSELFAIFNALRWLFLNLNNCNCVIYSDSRSALAMIGKITISSYCLMVSSIHLLICPLLL